MQTLLLDLTTWDLVVDANQNIAVASNPYSIAQDICSRTRLFLGELWYDTTQGINYFGQIFGQSLDANFIKAQIQKNALLVPNVTSATVFITQFTGRRLTGQIHFEWSVAANSAGSDEGRLIVSFVGDNGLLITFIGSNSRPLEFTGSA